MPKRADYHERFRGTVRAFFKEWREYRGLTQQRLADRLGTTKLRVSLKERGEESWDDAYLPTPWARTRPHFSCVTRCQMMPPGRFSKR